MPSSWLSISSIFVLCCVARRYVALDGLRLVHKYMYLFRPMSGLTQNQAGNTRALLTTHEVAHSSVLEPARAGLSNAISFFDRYHSVGSKTLAVSCEADLLG